MNLDVNSRLAVWSRSALLGIQIHFESICDSHARQKTEEIVQAQNTSSTELKQFLVGEKLDCLIFLKFSEPQDLYGAVRRFTALLVTMLGPPIGRERVSSQPGVV